MEIKINNPPPKKEIIMADELLTSLRAVYSNFEVSKTSIKEVFKPLADITKLESPELTKAWNEVWEKFESKQPGHMRKRTNALRNHVIELGLYHPDDPISFFEEAVKKAEGVEADKKTLMNSIFDRPEINDAFTSWTDIGSSSNDTLDSLLHSSSVQEFAEKFKVTMGHYKELVSKREKGILEDVEETELNDLERDYPKINQYSGDQIRNPTSSITSS